MASIGYERTRGGLILGCLAAALLLAGFLGWQAVTAARGQRRAVEGVLHDYAALAAEQYARNVNVTFDYEWFLPTLRLVEAQGLASGNPESGDVASGDTASGGAASDTASRGAGAAGAVSGDPVSGDLEVAGQRSTYTLAEAATAIFELAPRSAAFRLRPVRHPASGVTESMPAADAERLRDEIVAHAAAHAGDEWPFAAFLRAPADEPRLVVYRFAGSPAGEPAAAGRIEGFVATGTLLASFLERSLTLYDLLPATLTADADGRQVVHVRVLAADGTTVFEQQPVPAAAMTATQELPPRLGALRVVASIPNAAAGVLVVGGLPYSRLPLVIGLLAITTGLLAAGAVLWRREQELIRLREQFVAGASHELRTPLAQIRMFAETLRLQRVRSDEEEQRSLEILDREARRLSLLVDNLLQFSRGTAAARFTPEDVDVSRLLHDVVEGFEPVAAARGVTVRIDTAGGADESAGKRGPSPDERRHPAASSSRHVVPGDRDMLRQILLNLLDNAVKYGPDGQTVGVEIVPAAEALTVAVIDQGPGIPAAERSLVWQRFWRGPRANGITGTGIGLALVRELVEQHGGTVDVRAGAGGGARFEVRLPRMGRP